MIYLKHLINIFITSVKFQLVPPGKQKNDLYLPLYKTNRSQKSI